MANPQRISPFLWFDTNAEEAVDFYVSVFPGSRKGEVTRYGDGLPMPRGTVMTVSFELAGQRFTALNGGPMFKFNESVSFVISCDTQAEIDHYWDRLSGNGGQPVQCGWLKDRYGLSWQVVPRELPELMKSPNAGKVMQAIMQMSKLDLATLRAAAAGR